MILQAAAAALSETGDGVQRHRLLRSGAAADGDPRRRPRRCASPTSGCTRTRAPAARPRAGRAPTCCCACSRSAIPTSATHLDRGHRPVPADRATGLGIPEEDMTALTQAAALHDVGKAAVPDAILEQARPADRRGDDVHPAPHDHRRADPGRGSGAVEAREARPLEPRAIRGRRLPGRHRRATRSRSGRGSSASATPTTR